MRSEEFNEPLKDPEEKKKDFPENLIADFGLEGVDHSEYLPQKPAVVDMNELLGSGPDSGSDDEFNDFDFGSLEMGGDDLASNSRNRRKKKTVEEEPEDESEDEPENRRRDRKTSEDKDKKEVEDRKK